MNLEKAGLITFLGNYLINTIVAALVAFVPASAVPGVFTPQYISFVVLAALVAGLLATWYGVRDMRTGLIFGAIGFGMSLLVAFVSGIAGILASPEGSLKAVWDILPNFFDPFLWNGEIPVWKIWEQSTVWLLAYWMIPTALVGWWHGRSKSPSAM